MVDSVKAAGNFIVDGVERNLAWVKEEYIKTLKGVTDFFEHIKVQFLRFLDRHPKIKLFLKVAGCIHNAVSGLKRIGLTIWFFIEMIPTMHTPVFWIKLVINLVCGWRSLLKAINQLIDFFNVKDAVAKADILGRFFANILAAIAGTG